MGVKWSKHVILPLIVKGDGLYNWYFMPKLSITLIPGLGERITCGCLDIPLSLSSTWRYSSLSPIQPKTSYWFDKTVF